jgi:hypothetical protein
MNFIPFFRFSLLMAMILPALCSAQKIAKEGDLLFLDLDCGDLCDAIEAVTEGAGGKDYSHLGMLILHNDSLHVLEAIGNAVQLSGLSRFLSYTSKPALHARLKPEFQPLIPTAIAKGKSCLGKPYDDAFLSNNEKYYCSELIYEAFKEANKGKPFFKLDPMTFKKPGSELFFPVWVEYYSNLGIPIPEGLPGCNPGGISRSEKLKILGYFNPTK